MENLLNFFDDELEVVLIWLLQLNTRHSFHKIISTKIKEAIINTYYVNLLISINQIRQQDVITFYIYFPFYSIKSICIFKQCIIRSFTKIYFLIFKLLLFFFRSRRLKFKHNSTETLNIVLKQCKINLDHRFLYIILLYQAPKEVWEIMEQRDSLTLENNVMRAAHLTASQKERYPFTKIDLKHDDPFIIIHAKPAAFSARKAQKIEGGCSYQRNVYAQAVAKFKVETAEEKTARLAREEAVAIKNEKNTERNLFHVYVLLHVILQNYPKMVKKSAEYLINLAKQSQLLPSVRKELIQNKITEYLTFVNYKSQSSPFIELLSELLNNCFLEISRELQKSHNLTQMNANIEIISILLKTIFEFQEYLPPDDYLHNYNSWHIKLQKFYSLFKINPNQFQLLKKLFLQNYSRITYLSKVPHIHDFLQTYYLIQLKKRLCKTRIEKFVKFKLFMNEFRARKKEAMQRRMIQMKGKQITLSQLFEQNKRRQNPIRIMGEELIQTLEIFQKINMANQTDKSQRHALLNYLSDKYKINIISLRQKFKRYIIKINLLKEKYGNDLSELKDALIMKQIAKNPDCNYEEVFNNIYHSAHLYIKQDYFENNVHRLLAKETHYQQLRYLERVLIGADLLKDKTTVLFVDCCSLMNTFDRKVVIAVTLAGKLFCRKFQENLGILDNAQQFLKDLKPSIVIFFNDYFPASQKIFYSGLNRFRKIHTVLQLPRVSLAPNPCRAIANSLRAVFRAKFNQSCDQEAVLQAVLQEFEPRVKEIVEKEWEKVQQLIQSAHVDYFRKQENIPNSGSDSSMEEESEHAMVRQSKVMEERQMREEDQQLSDSPMRFPRGEGNVQGKEGIFQQHLIMENLRAYSVEDLRFALTRLRNINTKSLFLKCIQTQSTVITS